MIFADSDVLYMVMADEIENRMKELVTYRKQQVSNHVKLSLDIVTPSKKSESLHFYDGDSHDSDEILIDYRHSSMDTTEHIAKYSKSDSLESNNPETYFE